MTSVARIAHFNKKNEKIQSRVILHRVFVYFTLFFILFIHIVEILFSKIYDIDLV